VKKLHLKNYILNSKTFRRFYHQPDELVYKLQIFMSDDVKEEQLA
jgi:hypothetical protein